MSKRSDRPRVQDRMWIRKDYSGFGKIIPDPERFIRIRPDNTAPDQIWSGSITLQHKQEPETDTTINNLSVALLPFVLDWRD
jgi:hypothetical protein